MSRKLTSRSSLENLKREAKRWLNALRENQPDARARFARAHPQPPPHPGLRDVQHALAREHGFAGWAELKNELARRSAESPATSRDAAVPALMDAAGRGDTSTVNALLDAYPDILNERAGNGARTALHRAVFGLSEAAVQVLLARGADPNIRDNDPRTGEDPDGDNAMPLHFAAEKGHMGIVRCLVEHGADTVGDDTYHELNVLGWATCFDYAYHQEVADYLLEHGAQHTIHTAVAMGDVDAIRELADRSRNEGRLKAVKTFDPAKGVKFNSYAAWWIRQTVNADLDRPMDRTNRRRRPLHLAVIKKRPESLAALLELGADTKSNDVAGLTPLDQAALNGEQEMVKRLIDHGAEIRLPAAVALGRQDDIERLLRDDSDCLRPGGRWEKLILRASESATGRVVEMLIRAGASVHTRDDPRTAVDRTHGYTPLHAAATNGNADAVRVLLEHGANPTDRDDKWWGTPAGWAAYFGHTDVRDIILDGPIDIFDAIAFDRTDRIPEILTRDPVALNRRFGERVTGAENPHAWLDAAWTPVAFAVANGKLEAVRTLIDRGADLSVRDSQGRTLTELANGTGDDPGSSAQPAEVSREAHAIAELLAQHASGSSAAPRAGGSFDERVADFLRMACLDWRVSGGVRTRTMHDAGRLLERDPALARASIHTAVACGDIDEVRRILDDQPEAAYAIGGPRSWPPLLYLCAARLTRPGADQNAAAIMRLLLDHGADPNAFYLGGNADIHYTALTCVLGRGEELASMHPAARELTRLLLERGADPHDNQVLYNVFADNTSRHLLDDDIVWLLELMYEHSVRRGHEADWENPTWPMFDMRGAPSLGDEHRRYHGARFMLDAAVDRNLLRLAEWMLSHGAGPNTPVGELWRRPKRTLYEEALSRGYTAMADLLVRHGATPTRLRLEGIDEFVAACLEMNRPRVQAMIAEHPEYLHDHRPLFAAVANDRVDVAEMLLDLGVSPDTEDSRHGGTRALHIAAGRGAVQCATLLIERGADVDPRETNFDGTPLGWANWAEQRQMVELLGRYSRNVWSLTYTGRVERLREVLRDEPGLAHVTSPSGDTPLMWLPDDPDAALEIASLLVEHGADARRRNAQGLSAADIAGRRGLEDVAALLRSQSL